MSSMRSSISRSRVFLTMCVIRLALKEPSISVETESMARRAAHKKIKGFMLVLRYGFGLGVTLM